MIEYLRLNIEYLRSAYGGSNLNCVITKIMERWDYHKFIFSGYIECTSDIGCGSGFPAARSNAAAGKPLLPISWFNGSLDFLDNQVIFFNSQFPDQAESLLCCDWLVRVGSLTQTRGF